MYSEDELLMLSGIQHIVFCERQWALIHIEQAWAENVLTVEGHHLHERVDDPFASESGVNKIIWRSLPLLTCQLGLYGRADVVELHPAVDDLANSITHAEKGGQWHLFPVEYKRGKPKSDSCDEVQLCAQSMCLEETYGVTIGSGALYYGETRHRHEVHFTTELRQQVIRYSDLMHQLYREGRTPPAVYAPKCKSCSLMNECMPKSMTGKNDVGLYLSQNLSDVL